MLGSLIVALKVIQNMRTGEGKSYGHIILTLCLVDFCSSLAFAFSTLPMEQGVAPMFGHSYRYGAQGTEGTCIAQVSGRAHIRDFFRLFVVASFHLTVGCSLFHYELGFLHSIRDCHHLLELLAERTLSCRSSLENARASTKEICGSWHPRGASHRFLCSFWLSVTPLVLEAYAHNPLWCWIGPNLSKCKEEGLMPPECKERAYRRRDAFYFFPLWTMVGLTTIVQGLLVWTVFRTNRKVTKWRFSRHQEGHRRRSSSTIRKMKRRERRIRQAKQSTRRVALQSALYLASFYVAWVPWIIAANRTRTVDNVLTDHVTYWIVLCVATLQPLQGFLNCWVYFHSAIVSYVQGMAGRCCSNCSPTAGEEDEDNENVGDSTEGIEEGWRSNKPGESEGRPSSLSGEENEDTRSQDSPVEWLATDQTISTISATDMELSHMYSP